jgi:adenosylcobinamide-GDP ribazoletransferase
VRGAITAPLVALGFLTVFPVTLPREVPPSAFPRAVALFPLVGGILGLVVAGLDLVARLALPTLVVSALDLVLLVLLTGGLHIDGLGDAADGLLSVMDTSRRLDVMRSGAVGPFGVAAIGLALLLEFSALASVGTPARLGALIVAATLSRWSMGVALWAWPYARPTGAGRAFKSGLRFADVGLATIIAVGIAFSVLGGYAAIVIAATLAVLVAVGALARKRIGGVTGDVCGAIGELAFATSLVALAGARA